MPVIKFKNFPANYYMRFAVWFRKTTSDDEGSIPIRLYFGDDADEILQENGILTIQWLDDKHTRLGLRWTRQESTFVGWTRVEMNNVIPFPFEIAGRIRVPEEGESGNIGELIPVDGGGGDSGSLPVISH